MTPSVSIARVSNRGQTSVPAALRHRWGIEEGGAIAFLDLGNAALVLPGGIEQARAELRRVLLVCCSGQFRRVRFPPLTRTQCR